MPAAVPAVHDVPAVAPRLPAYKSSGSGNACGGRVSLPAPGERPPTRTPPARLPAQAAAVLEVCRARGVPLLINDRVDVALAVGADGVHVGQVRAGWASAGSLARRAGLCVWAGVPAGRQVACWRASPPPHPVPAG